MALDVSNNNLQYNLFVMFAEDRMNAGKSKAVARIDTLTAGPLAARSITTSTGDWVGVGGGRLAKLKKYNNATRDAFMDAVCKMFGGRDRIPDSVKAAMKLEDYGKGKPLTARRILAVAKAVDAAMTEKALTDGLSEAEVGKMRRAADFYAKATGWSEKAALLEVMTPGTDANRLMKYGGRFLNSDKNFENGLKVLSKFKSWYSGLETQMKAGNKGEGASLTVLNARPGSFPANKLAEMETLVFESIAHDPDILLSAEDANRLFGMENNVATRFFGLGLNNACTHTLAQIPPEKRNAVYSALALFHPLSGAENAAGEPGMHGPMSTADDQVILARILRHIDEVVKLSNDMKLNLGNFVKLCFPEFPEDGKCSVGEVKKVLDGMAGKVKGSKEDLAVAYEELKKEVASKFGGEENIPGIVKDAMNMPDIGNGRPSTEQRILAVNEAVTAATSDIDGKALSAGFSKAEVENMHKAADFYAKATGCSYVKAFTEVSTPRSNANRLMNYGGKFLDSPENFKKGLDLLPKFEKWFNGVGKAVNADGELADDETNQTLLNAGKSSFDGSRFAGTEKFVFESIANDPSFNLGETDENRLFGMEHNLATRFFGLGLNNSCTQTIAQMPPDERNTLFSAIALFYPLAESAEQAKLLLHERGSLDSADSPVVIARILKHFDEVSHLKDSGTLTLENLVPLCFPELKDKTDFSVGVVKGVLKNMGEKLRDAAKDGVIDAGGMVQAMIELWATGCTVEEAIDSCKGGKQQERLKYVAGGTMNLSAYNGTTKDARAQLKLDLKRPESYFKIGGGDSLLQNDECVFTFNLPNSRPLVTGRTEKGKANIDVVCDKVESLCGKAHLAQANSVMMMLTQAGRSVLRGGLSPRGYTSHEHSACDFTLTKDENTGNVTIRYTSPKSLPFLFEWTATVRPDGFVTTTPFQFSEGGKMLEALNITGNAAGQIGNMILPGSGLIGAEKPEEELKKRMDSNATAALRLGAMQAISDMRTEGKGSDIDLNRYPPAFEADMRRNLNVSFSGGGPLFNLGPAKARDAYVSFITGGKVKTYAEADRKTKVMACLLMALSTQNFLTKMSAGVGTAFDADGNSSRVQPGGVMRDDGTTMRSIVLSKNDEGNFVFKGTMVKKPAFLNLTDGNGVFSLYKDGKGGGSVEYGFNVVITAESLEKFAGANWKEVDSVGIKAMADDNSAPYSINRAADGMPKDIQLDMTVDVSFSVHVDELKDAAI